jgi:hypothetical protein
MTAACATALLTGFGGTGWAQDVDDEDDVDVNIDADDGDVTVDHDDDEYGYDVDKSTGPMSGIGTSVQVGGGAFGFTDEETNDFTNTGGSWTARLVLGTRMPLALEAAYIGTANDIDALGLDSSAVLLGNGAEANVRWNIMSTLFRSSIDTGIGHIDPYVFGGIAYKRYSLVNDDFNTSSVRENDNVGEVPMGGGLAWMVGGFAVDARGEFRYAFSDRLFSGTEAENNLNNWNVSARLGWEF